jgi:hypothetical protein
MDMSNKTKLAKLLIDCEKLPGKQFVLQLGKEDVSLMGLGPKPVAPSSAIVMQKSEGTTLIRGNFNGYTHEINTPDNSWFIGVNCQDDDNIKIYYDFGEGENKITSKTIMGSDDIFIVFWEAANLACLTICSHDSVNGTIREIISADDEPTKRLFRAIASKFAELLLPRLEETDDASFDNFREEYSDHESIFLR